ncbi:MAG: hypothetical protein EA405_06500 [Rhodospirillales bacterium]|nr:MAG: hypothetical protein EA405_06500 [Rhodospirillales bacterium]TVR99905.1 MAG: hypothetical protein EA406_01935 [Rhodospirillales bacterium]
MEPLAEIAPLVEEVPEQVFTVMDGLTTGLIGYGLMIVVALASAVLIRVIVVALHGMQKAQQTKLAAAGPPTAVSVAVAPPASAAEEQARHAAVIAAAVYAMIGAHRLVYVSEAETSPTWRTTGRAIHQTSRISKRAPQ